MRQLITTYFVATALTMSLAAGAHTVVVIDDHFNDGEITTNTTGIGNGHTLVSSDSVLCDEYNTQWGVDARNAVNWGLAALSSRDVAPGLSAPGAVTTAEWTVQFVGVTVDQTAAWPQLPGNEAADLRSQFGLVSALANNFDNVSDELYWNTAGGIYVNILYEQKSAANVNDLIVTGNIQLTNKNHPPHTDQPGTAGLLTLATFSIARPVFHFSQSEDNFIVRLQITETGYNVLFFNVTDGREIEPSVMSGSLSGNWNGFITDEFNTGVFASTMAQNIGAGRGYVELDRLRIEQVIPEPASLSLLAIGGLTLLRRRQRTA